MDVSNRYTVNDVAKMSGHAELIDGDLVVQNRTSDSHNATVLTIAAAFMSYIAEHGGNCKVRTDTVGLYINELCDSECDYYLPDVMVVCDPNGIKDDGVHVAPRFVAEVTSEGTSKNDYRRKLNIYEEIGVDEYWIVDLQKQIVTQYLKEEDYIPEKVAVTTYPGLAINLAEYMK